MRFLISFFPVDDEKCKITDQERGKHIAAEVIQRDGEISQCPERRRCRNGPTDQVAHKRDKINGNQGDECTVGLCSFQRGQAAEELEEKGNGNGA